MPQHLLNFYSVWPFFVETALIVALVSTPVFRAADTPPIPTKVRVRTLDGLRGYLALSVFFHHAVIYHRYMDQGLWLEPPTRFYAALGPIAVAMFFMITGYLFWTQMLKTSGQPNWLKLYVGRFFRIMPLYWLAIALVLIEVAAKTGWRLHVSIWKLVKQIIEWSAGGLLAKVPVNGYEHTSELIASVTWTLRLEWFFYASLLVMALAARKKMLGVVAPLAALVISVIYDSFSVYSTPLGSSPIRLTLFLVGMSVASFHFTKPKMAISNTFGSLAILTLLIFGVVAYPNPVNVWDFLVIGLAFLLIASGANVFGLLTSRSAIRLGDISFGLYLLQGPILAAEFAIPPVRSFAQASALGYWVSVMFAAVALVAVATLTHILVERPGIELGRKLVTQRSISAASHS